MTKLIFTLLAIFSFTGVAAADDLSNSLSFFYRVATAPALNPVTSVTPVTFPDTAIGKTSTVSFLIQTSQSSQNVYAIVNPQVNGIGFSLGPNSGTVPAMASGFGVIPINFTPTTGEFANGTLSFTLTSTTGLKFEYSFTLFGRITSPKLVTSYSLSSTNNQTVIQPGSTIPFPNTAVNGMSQATFIIANSGTGPATVDAVTLAGDAYKLTDLALVPAVLSAGGDFRFGITFTPVLARRYAGTLTVSLNGTAATYLLDGQGTSATLTYQTLSGSTARPLAPGATIALPDTAADGVSRGTVTIQVTNTGNADGMLANISVSGADFQLANVPAPRILAGTNSTSGASSSATFDVIYLPSKPGPSTGRLQVGNDFFPLTGNGLGALLSVSADVGTGPIAVVNKGTIAVPNTLVGARRSVFITVTNTGNQPATVSSFSASGIVFTTPTSAALPVALGPGQSQRFEVRFAPIGTGAVTGTLTVNDQTFTLVGSGDPPAALPAVTISGAGAQTDPLQQPAITVQLAAAYSSDLRGVLTLAFFSDSFSDDPAIQFANGTRTVNFTVPANTTQAVFDQLGRTAAFQTGTVSGRIVFSTTFTVGTVDLTPATVPSLATTIPQGPPQLSSVRLGTQGTNTVQLLVSGYSTSRSVQQLALQFTGAAGTNLQTTAQTVDVSSAFTNWYADPSSRAFGSQFTLTLTLTVTGDLNALQSISVTASNARGTSTVKSVALR